MQIGKTDSDNKQNWIARFPTKGERNSVLFARRELKIAIPKGCTMLRDIPEEYRQRFRDFEIKAKNMAIMTQYTSKAFIDFEGTTLVLKMSEKGNMRRQLMESFDPCEESIKDREKNTLLKMFEPESRAMRTILMSAIAENTAKEDLEKDIKEVLSKNYKSIESIELNKKSAVIICTTRAEAESCRDILATKQKGLTTTKVFCNELYSLKQLEYMN